jgi:hypothetical protein
MATEVLLERVRGSETPVDAPTAEPNGQAHPAFESRTDSFRARWHEIQERFVDEPRQSVQEADHLVADVIRHINGALREERAKLEHDWHGENQPSTECLRLALRRYRSFFDRLLSA